MSQPPSPERIVVIGAGFVGLCCALHLQRDGHDVTVIDRGEPGRGTSFGNAGVIAVSAASPLASAGSLGQLPRMLLDPLGPLVIRWRYALRIAPWMIRLLQASTPARIEAAAGTRSLLASRAWDAWADLARQVSAGNLVRPTGYLKAYTTDRAFAAAQMDRDLMTANDLPIHVLSADELRQLEPALAPIFRHGVFVPGGGSVANPFRLAQTLAADFAARGGTIVRAEVRDIALAPDGRPRVESEAGNHACDRVVLAAGAWSRRLAARAGIRAPLDTERGYHLMLPKMDNGLRRPTLWAEHSFFLCPMEEGVRLTSGVEFAGLDAPPDYRRIRGLLPLAEEMLPGLKGEPTSEWLGFRPSMPDAVPVIGPVPGCERICFAFGHGHDGLGMAAVTGRLVADLAAGRDPGFDPAPFSPARFRRGG